jgi:2-haloacid dehalogenase
MAIVPAFTKLPPHPDVIEGLTELKNRKFRLVSLTHSTGAGVKAKFENAGLLDLFECRPTVEGIQKFKPDQAVDQWALDQMKVEAGEAMLVAAHVWDIAGTNAAGFQTVFVARPGSPTPGTPPAHSSSAAAPDAGSKMSP